MTMTCEQALALLDDHVDGVLSEAEHQEIELHVASCEACRKEEAALRAFLAQAASLKRDRVPAHDLWPAIASRLGEEKRVLGFLPRRLVIPAGLAAAAAVAAVWFVARPQVTPAPAGVTPGTLTQAATSGSSDIAQAEAEYVRATNQLLTVLNARKKGMPTEDAKALDLNLLKIDASLHEVREALDKDPQNPKLTRMLASTHQKKLDLLLRLIRLSSQIS
jgi:Putative zinc-finger